MGNKKEKKTWDYNKEIKLSKLPKLFKNANDIFVLCTGNKCTTYYYRDNSRKLHCKNFKIKINSYILNLRYIK